MFKLLLRSQFVEPTGVLTLDPNPIHKKPAKKAVFLCMAVGQGWIRPRLPPADSPLRGTSALRAAASKLLLRSQFVEPTGVLTLDPNPIHKKTAKKAVFLWMAVGQGVKKVV